MAEETTPQAGTTDAGQAPADDQFDADRAKALIDKLRPFEKQAKQLERELAELRQAEDQRKRAEMSELDKLKADLETERQARTAAEEGRRQQLLRTQVISAAAKAGFNDPEDAVQLLDPTGLEIDDNGQIGGLEREMKALLAAKPYLAKQSGTISPTNPAGGAAGQSDAERLKRIYGVTGKSNIFGGPGGGVVWNSKE